MYIHSQNILDSTYVMWIHHDVPEYKEIQMASDIKKKKPNIEY